MFVESIRAGLVGLLLLWTSSAVLGEVSLVDASKQKSVALAWDPSPDANVTGYNLYYGYVSGDLTNQLNVGNLSSAALEGLVPGTTYFFTVKAYDATGIESQPSNEIQYTATNLPSSTLNAALALIDQKSVQLNFPGVTGVTYRIEATEDFQTWTTVLTTNLTADGPISLTVTDPNTYAKRFFRIAQN